MNHPGLSNELGMKLLEQVRSGRTILPMVSRWTSVKVEAVEYPILLTEMLEEANPPSSGRRKYIATIYDPAAIGSAKLEPPDRYGQVHVDRAATIEGLMKPGLYWRGESYLGFEEALRNAAAAMSVVPQVEEGEG